MELKQKIALIAGGTGLIGNELLHLLLDGNVYNEVIALVRRPLEISHNKLTEVIVDFDELDYIQDRFAVDDVYCCLGTTIKKAKTKEAMTKVDVEYPLAIAKIAREKGAKHFLLVSSMNANPNSIVWYSSMKGRLEQELSKVPFQSISILRPSLLLGERKEFRLGEWFAAIVYRKLSFIFKGASKKYGAIEGKKVALAMYRIAQLNKKGLTIYQSDEIETKAVSTI